MVLTNVLIRNLKKQFSAEEIFDAEECEEVTVSGLDEKKDVGKIIVVVDYHM